MVNRLKTFLTSSLITIQSFVVVSHYVRAHEGDPIIFLGHWVSADRMVPYVCYHTNFSRPRSNRFRVGIGGPEKFWRRWGLWIGTRPQSRSLESQTAGLQSLWLARRLKPWLVTIDGL